MVWVRKSGAMYPAIGIDNRTKFGFFYIIVTFHYFGAITSEKILLTVSGGVILLNEHLRVRCFLELFSMEQTSGTEIIPFEGFVKF